ncbi:MAG: zinc-ribbon domain-containing protein [Pyrinomonadaceae bacterium]
MYCPNCGTQNIDGASFCRSCGANLSLVPQALTGQLPEAPVVEGEGQGSRRRRKGKNPPSLESAVRNIFVGVAFLFVSLAVMRFMPGGRFWWFWLLIPAFSLLGGGVAEYLRLRQPAAPPSLPPGRTAAAAAAPTFAPPSQQRAGALPPQRDTGELYAPPPSVTEGTTRLLDQEPQTRLFDTPPAADRQKES